MSVERTERPSPYRVGLAVAILSVTLYNLLARRAKNILLQWDIRHEKQLH